ncbi:MAG: DEAD/DEAH box helicase [Thermoplasmatota archaeon]
MADEDAALGSLHPAVAAWFRATFATPTLAQAKGWPAIARGEDTLILSPTGSGKTLAAFLVAVSDILRSKTGSDGPAPAGDEGAAHGGEGRSEPGDAPPRRRGVGGIAGTRGKNAARGARGVRSAHAAGPVEGIREGIPARGIHTIYVSPLKALNADVHANLEAPLAGIRGIDPSLPAVTRALRTGDTPQSERESMIRRPPDILVTTPESLYLLVTSGRSRAVLRNVRCVILDEIHAVLGGKRGVHLALTIERLAELSPGFQRIGLSATVRPTEEAAHFLGGLEDGKARPVTTIDARVPKRLDIHVEWPQGREGADEAALATAWPPIQARIRDLVDAHRTTVVFTNNRRLAERLARRLTDLNPHRPLPAHHGSLSKERRRELELSLKAGKLAGIVATSSLELGIDVGDVDLAVLVGSPRTVSTGLQRVGRAGHQVGETSEGRIFPTHRADLLEAATVAEGVLHGRVEETRSPKLCLDVLAQQIVAHVAATETPVHVDSVLSLARRSWPYRDLTRAQLESVLEMLGGKYPAEAFRELRARLAWDKRTGILAPLRGSRLLAIRNGGTIPDRGTYAVYLADGRTRLGELDEEYVFESRVGDVFALGANAWRIIAIEESRVVVEDAHGEPPEAPFWKGDRPPRGLAASLEVGRFLREAESKMAEPSFETWLREAHGLNDDAGAALYEFLTAQRDATGRLPTDRTVLVEHFRDDSGDARLAIHAPFGAAVNGPWALAIARAMGDFYGAEVQSFVGDDGFLLRLPDADLPPPIDIIAHPDPEAMMQSALEDLGDTALFAGRFRECAERALLLPRPPPGQRRPLWVQRLRANDLLQVARRFEDFPIVVEAYRDVLTGPIDAEGLRTILRAIHEGAIEVVSRTTDSPSPFAETLLFGFVGAYIYEQPPPPVGGTKGRIAVRREMIEDILEPARFRSFLRPEAIEAEVAQASGRAFPPRTPDELALLVARAGDLDDDEIAALAVAPAAPSTPPAADAAPMAEAGPVAKAVPPEGVAPPEALAEALATRGSIVRLRMRGRSRWILATDVAAFRAALGREEDAAVESRHRSAIPDAVRGLAVPAEALMALYDAGAIVEGAKGQPTVPDVEEKPARRGALLDCLRRFASTRPPFTAAEASARYGIDEGRVADALHELAETGILVRGAFTPGRLGEEYVDRKILEGAHRRTLVLQRREAQPVDGPSYARFLLAWQAASPKARRSGPGSLGAVMDQLKGATLPGEIWERDVLPARMRRYEATALTELATGGALVWVGAGAGRFRPLLRGSASPYVPAEPSATLSPAAQAVRSALDRNGASFFHEIDADLPQKDIASGLAELIRDGEVTNDSFEVMRHVLRTGTAVIPRAPPARRILRTGLTGRWSLLKKRSVLGPPIDAEEATRQVANDLLARYGVVVREVARADGCPIAWGDLARVLARMEARGEVRRGYFVQGLSGEQYAAPQAVQRLREARKARDDREAVVLNVLDPANPWGATLPLPEGPRFSRAARNYVVLFDGEPVVLAAKEGRDLIPTRKLDTDEVRAVARALQGLLGAPAAVRRRRSVVVERWAGRPPASSPAVVRAFLEEGFELEHGRLALWPSHLNVD